MPYVKQARKIGVGISFDPDTLRRIDDLTDGGRRQRSAFISQLVEVGLESRFGPDWREQADRKQDAESEAA